MMLLYETQRSADRALRAWKRIAGHINNKEIISFIPEAVINDEGKTISLFYVLMCPPGDTITRWNCGPKAPDKPLKEK